MPEESTNGDGRWWEWRGATDHRLKTVEEDVSEARRLQEKIFDRISSLEKRIAAYAGGAAVIVVLLQEIFRAIERKVGG